MMRKIGLLLIGISILMPQAAYPSTLLYSMKIRTVFQKIRQDLHKEGKTLWILTALPILYARQVHVKNKFPFADIREKRLTIGSIFNVLARLNKNVWFEITGAIEKERARAKGKSEDPYLPVMSEVSRVGGDDVTIAGGYHWYPTEHLQYDAYIIFGFPTHWKVSKKDSLGPLVGSRVIGLGAGAEVSYSFIQNLRRLLLAIGQARCIHFFKRDWYPVLPPCSILYPGETFDLLAAIRYREQFEIIEVGYNPTFFLNQAAQIPCQEKKRLNNYVRNGAYMTYSHYFQDDHYPAILGFGFDFNITPYLRSRAFGTWLDLTVIF